MNNKNHKHHIHSPREIRDDIKIIYKNRSPLKYYRDSMLTNYVQEKLRLDKIRKRYKEQPDYDKGEQDDF